MKKLILIAALIAAPLLAHATEYFSESVSNTKIEVSAVPCRLMAYKVINRDSTNPIYVHIYDSLAANVTVGTTAQVDFIAVPANGAAVFNPNGSTLKVLATGLTIAITTSPLSTGTTAPGTAAVVKMTYQ